MVRYSQPAPLPDPTTLLDITENELFDFIVGDFEAAWDALASAPAPGHRGNFLFARHAVGLLEVACRLCKSDATGLALAVVLTVRALARVREGRGNKAAMTP